MRARRTAARTGRNEEGTFILPEDRSRSGKDEVGSDSQPSGVYNSVMRKTLSWIGLAASVLVPVAFPGLRGDTPAAAVPLPELIEILRTHLSLGPAEFESRASGALIEHFGVRRAEPAGDDPKATPDPGASKETLAHQARLDGGLLYLRIGRVDTGLAGALRAALTDATATNASPGAATGLVLDLRFARGESLEAAGEAAALFSDRTEAVLHWGSGSTTGSGARRVWSLPMAILVNGRTEGAAEALAAALRHETGGALLGQPTAGAHGVFREVTLKDGSRLRVPAGRIRLGDGSPMAAGPIQPDIRIPVPESLERTFLKNPTASVTSTSPQGSIGTTGTNSAGAFHRRKVTEADLVRATRTEPVEPAAEASTPAKAPAPTRLADPVLARAADLVRGLAAFQKGR